MRRRHPLAAALAITALTSVAGAEDVAPAKRALAVELTPAWTRLLLPAGPHDVETSRQNGGPAIVVGVSLRTAYFLAPFLEGSWFSLYSDHQQKNVPGFGVIAFDASMSALAVLGGASFSFWRLRARAGIGTYSLHVSAHVLGDTLSTSELDMGYLVALGGWVWQNDRLRIGAEARADFIVQASTTFATLGITVAGDAVTW